MNYKYFIVICFCISVSATAKEISKAAKAEEPVKPEKLTEEIEKKTKAAQEARKRAEKAFQEAKKAEEEARKYEDLSERYKNTDPALYESMLKLQQEFSTEAKKQFSVQTSEKENATTYEQEVEKLTALQKEANAIESTFNESPEYENKLIEENFETCIDNLIDKSQKRTPFNNEEYKKLLKQFSDKLKELLIYERSTFYKSSAITNEQWNKIHQDALNNRGTYELKYKQLLQSLEQIKASIKKLLKQNTSISITSSDIHDCFKKNYPALEQKLITLEKRIIQESDGDESSPWN